MNQQVNDITDAEFEQAVIQRSSEIPVVIDLWAPWCGPCRQLTPILEKVAADRGEEFELVKLNVDENPEVAALLGARSIPLVVAFRGGERVDQFMGLQPESAINQFIDRIQPSEADKLVQQGMQLFEQGNKADAFACLRQAVSLERHHEDAHLVLATMLSSEGEHDQALTVLNAVPSNGHDAAARLQAEIRTQMAGSEDVAELQAEFERQPDDMEAGMRLAGALAAGADYQSALTLLLELISRDPGYNDGAARRAMLDVLEILGPGNDLTREYRRKLAKLLF